MDIDHRNELIDQYYEAVDDAAYDRMVSVFAEDITYLYPGEEPMHGHDEVKEFFEERRPTSETTHDVFHRIHNDEATACEGTITGKMKGDRIEGAYVGIFKFDDETERISYVGVYTRL